MTAPPLLSPRRLAQSVAVAHRGIVWVDLALSGRPKAGVDLIQMLAHIGLLGVGDAAPVWRAGMLRAGEVDTAARARTGAELGDKGVLDGRLYYARARQEVELVGGECYALPPVGSWRDPFDRHEVALERLDLLGERVESHR